MKRLSILFALATFFTFSPLERANAVVFTCVNCSTIFQQIPEFIKGSITAAQTTATAINTQLLQMQATVLDPLQNAMIANTLLTQQANTINLITGAMGGQQLLKSNPEEWIDNQGLNVVRLSINDLSNQNGAYSSSLLGTLIDNYRNSTNLETKLQTYGQSSIPSMVQNNLCADATLTSVARNDVMGSDGSVNPNELLRRKQEIFNQLCRGNPATDQALSNRLTRVSEQRPDIGGWDTLLAIGNGDNGYTQSVRLSIDVSKEVEEKKQAARDDLNRGGGVASATECSDPASSQPNIANLPCRNTVITTPGSTANSAFQQWVNAPAQRVIASFGQSAVGSIYSLLAAKNTTDLLTNAIREADHDPNNDLVDNPEGRAAVSEPVGNYLDIQEDTVDKLETANQGLIVEIGNMESLANEIKACYDNLVRDGMTTESSVPNAYRYVTNKNNQAAQLRTRITEDETKISEARVAIASLRARIGAARSSAEVQAIFNEYQEMEQDGLVPSVAITAQREGQMMEIRGDNQIERMEGGTAYTLKQQCETIRTNYWMMNQNGNGA